MHGWATYRISLASCLLNPSSRSPARTVTKPTAAMTIMEVSLLISTRLIFIS